MFEEMKIDRKDMFFYLGIAFMILIIIVSNQYNGLELLEYLQADRIIIYETSTNKKIVDTKNTSEINKISGVYGYNIKIYNIPRGTLNNLYRIEFYKNDKKLGDISVMSQNS